MSEQAAAPDKLSALATRMVEEAEQSADPNSWGEPEEVPVEEAPVDTEQPVEEPEGQPEQELSEIDIGGMKYQVPKAVADGYMKDADYRQKTMALAEDRKATEQVKTAFAQLTQQAHGLAQQAAQFAPAFGQIAAIDGQIQNLQAQLTPELRATDPVTYSTLASDVTLLAQHRTALATRVGQAMQQHEAQLAQVNAKANLERVQRSMPELNKAIPGGYTPEAAKRAQDYLVKSGLMDELGEVLPGAMDQLNYLPKAVLTMWKAAEYDRIQAETKVSLKRVEGLPPVAKPSAKAQSSEAKARTEKMREKFRESGGKDSQLSRALIRERLFGGS